MYVCICQEVPEGQVEVRHLAGTKCNQCVGDLLDELKTKLPPAFFEQIKKSTCINPDVKLS